MLKEKIRSTIYVSCGDEITIVISKIAKSKQRDIFLVVPPHSLLFQGVVNLQILYEEMEFRKLDLTVITTDKQGEELCERIGIKCRKNILDFHKKQSADNESKSNKHKEDVLFSCPADRFILNNSKKEKLLKKNILMCLPGLLLTIISVICAVFFLPSAGIFILARNRDFKKTIDIQINTVPQNESGDVFPARAIELNDVFSKNFSSSGENIIKEYSSGEAVIINEWDSSAHTFPSGTKLISENGKIYRLVSAATVGGFYRSGGKDIAGKVSAKIKADAPGDDYNIASSRFSIDCLKESDKHDKIYAVSDSAILGGKISFEKIVAEKDIAGANKAILEYVEKNNGSIFQIGEDETIAGFIPSKILKVSFSRKIGEAASEFAVNADIARKAIIINNAALEDYVKKKLNGAFSEVKIKIAAFESGEKGGNAKVIAEGELPTEIDFSEIKERVAGKSKGEALKILESLQEIEKKTIKIWPFWAATMPYNKNKIKIFLDRNNYFSIIN